MSAAREPANVVRIPDRALPRAEDAEREVLGAMLVDEGVIDQVRAVLVPQDFSAPNQDLYAAIIDLYDEGKPIAVLSVHHATNIDRLRLEDLAADVAIPASAPHHARTVRDRADRRRAILGLGELIENLYDPTTDADEIAALAARLVGDRDATDDLFTPQSLAALRQVIAERGPRSWLAEGLILEGVHGVLAAEPKAGKGWDAVDLAVSIASGTAWLEAFDCPTPGPVLLFAAEEDEDELLRRIDAVARSRHLDADTLPVSVVLTTPQVLNPRDLERMRRGVEAVRPVLVIVDPLYRAVAGAEPGNLYAMGEALGNLERITRAAGAALLVVHHYNRDATRKGAERFTGAGPREWGRFLIAATVKKANHIDGGSEVLRRVEVTGTSIGGRTFTVLRRITSEDPGDPSAPLAYHVEVIEAGDEADTDDMPEGLNFSHRRVLDALGDGPDQAHTIHEIQDVQQALGDGKPYTRQVLSTKLNELLDADQVGAIERDGRGTKAWYRIAEGTT